MASPSLVEIHDATVARLTLGLGGEAQVDFSHVAVYELRDADRYDLVSYEAVLVAAHVDECTCRGPLLPRNQVSTIRLEGLDVASSEITRLVTEPGHVLKGLLEILFTSGAVLTLRAGSISFALGRRGRRFDEWIGPL